MPSSFTAAEKKLWYIWIVAAILGPTLAAAAGRLLLELFPVTADNQLVFTIFLSALPLPGALLQWWTLRPYLKQAWWWIVATLAGSVLSSLAITLLQWVFLRRRVKRAYWWPIAGYLLQYGSTIYIARLGNQLPLLLILWLITGAISGWLMVLLLRQPWHPEDGHEFDQWIKAMEERQRAKNG